MADVEFVIPTNKDELLQGEPGQYTVTNVCSLPELSAKLSGKMSLFCLYCPVTDVTGIYHFKCGSYVGFY
jgi:hypothetical protein